MGAMDTRNMLSDFAVNKYLQTVASCWILLIQPYFSFLYFPSYLRKKSKNKTSFKQFGADTTSQTDAVFT